LKLFQLSRAIREHLLALDATNTQWQHDLSITAKSAMCCYRKASSMMQYTLIAPLWRLKRLDGIDRSNTQ
jgi:hypothetical protein